MNTIMSFRNITNIYKQVIYKQVAKPNKFLVVTYRVVLQAKLKASNNNNNTQNYGKWNLPITHGEIL